MKYNVVYHPVVREDLGVRQSYGNHDANKTRITEGHEVVMESFTPLRCSECGAYLGRRGTIDGHDYDDTAGWKHCPYCGREIAE